MRPHKKIAFLAVFCYAHHMREKDPYNPSPEKRFAISKDEYSRDRIKIIQEIYEEITKEFPFKVGFSLYGSLSKGKILDAENFLDADIDLVVYVDADDVAKNFNAFRIEHNLPKSADSEDLEQNRNTVRELVRSHIKNRLTSLPSNGELTKNIWMYDITTTDIQKLLENVSEHSDLHDSFELRKLVRMFHLDVGGGMKKYRVALLQYLKDRPLEYREKIWSKISSSLRLKERYNDIPSKISPQYPETFDEAYKYYVN